MRSSKLSALFVAAALAGAPTAVAYADATVAAEAVAVQPRAEAPDVTTDAAHYAAEEAKDTSVADFSGGRRNVIIIGSSTVVLILLVVLIVLLV